MTLLAIIGLWIIITIILIILFSSVARIAIIICWLWFIICISISCWCQQSFQAALSEDVTNFNKQEKLSDKNWFWKLPVAIAQGQCNPTTWPTFLWWEELLESSEDMDDNALSSVINDEPFHSVVSSATSSQSLVTKFVNCSVSSLLSSSLGVYVSNSMNFAIKKYALLTCDCLSLLKNCIANMICNLHIFWTLRIPSWCTILI